MKSSPVLCPRCGAPIPEGMWSCPCKKPGAPQAAVSTGQAPASDEAALAWKIAGDEPAPQPRPRTWRHWNIALGVGLFFLAVAIGTSLRDNAHAQDPDLVPMPGAPPAAAKGRCEIVDETMVANGRSVQVEGTLTNESKLVLGSASLQTEFTDGTGRPLGIATADVLGASPGKTVRYRTSGSLPIGIDTPQPITWRTRIKNPRWQEGGHR